MTDRIFRSLNVVLPGAVAPATIHVRAGRIERIAAFDDLDADASVTDYGHLTVMAGVVDSHVHANEPGRTEWEGFVTITNAAAAGGVTTIVDMPLNSIPATTSVDALMTKAASMEGKCRVDVGLWGGAVPGNAPELGDMLAHGALGFKCFLVDSGVPEFPHLDAQGLAVALRALRDTGTPLLVHAELAGPIDEAKQLLHGPLQSYGRYLASRPAAAEDEAIALLYDRCRNAGARAHVVHLSSANGLALLREARDHAVAMTAETTPHYLYFDAEQIPDGATEFKCAPPIREHANRVRLWQGLRDGYLNAIVSDHSPCVPELKRHAEGDFEGAWGGITSVQFGMRIVWTEGRKHGLSLMELSRLMSAGPAELAGIASTKGRLAVGQDADFVVWDPDAPFVVAPELIEHRHHLTPYMGRRLDGVVKATWLRGEKIWEDGLPVGAASGEWIKRD